MEGTKKGRGRGRGGLEASGSGPGRGSRGKEGQASAGRGCQDAPPANQVAQDHEVSLSKHPITRWTPRFIKKRGKGRGPGHLVHTVAEVPQQQEKCDFEPEKEKQCPDPLDFLKQELVKCFCQTNQSSQFH